jgi:hypothetical protein
LNNQRLGDDILLAPLLFGATQPIFGIEDAEAELLITMNMLVVQVFYDAAQVHTIRDLRQLLAHRFVFPTQTYNISIAGEPPLGPRQFLAEIKEWGSNPLVLDCSGEVRQVMTFWDINRDAEVGPFEFDLCATSDDVVGRLGSGHGTYKFYRSRNELGKVLVDGFPLSLIPVGADPMAFSFEPAAAPPPPRQPELLNIALTQAVAASASTVTITFILPPNDATEEVSIGRDWTVAQAIELSRRYFPADPNKVYGVRLSDDVDDEFLDPDCRVIDVDEPRDFFVAEAIAIMDDIGKRTVHVEATGSQTVGAVAKSLQAGSVIVDRRGVSIDPSLRMSWAAVKDSFPLRLIESRLERHVTVTYLDGTKHQHRMYCLSRVFSLREFIGELMGTPLTSFVFSDVSDDLSISDAPDELVCSAFPPPPSRVGSRGAASRVRGGAPPAPAKPGPVLHGLPPSPAHVNAATVRDQGPPPPPATPKPRDYGRLVKVLAKLTEHPDQLCRQCLNVFGYDFAQALQALEAMPR